jgi:NAD(P)-dependent dehydrogenase (short-subunit alcohol dehydrogenase family)
MARIPAGRLGQPEKSLTGRVRVRSASYINGITLPVDGGKQAV